MTSTTTSPTPLLPPAGLQQAVQQALAQTLTLERPADVQLRQFFRAHPSLGRRDRGLIAETVFDVLRNRRLYASLAEGGSGRPERRLMLLSLAMRSGADGGAGAFERHGPSLPPSPVEAEWLARLAQVDRAALAPALRLSLPDWIHARLVADHGPQAAAAIGGALLSPAPLDLRVNTLKADVGQARAALAQAGIQTEPIPGLPGALRAVGKPALERAKAFEDGWVEVQDAGSQLLALLAAPRRGQTVVDFCAGAGGKTLALAALMRSTGQVYACDVSTARLQRLRPRLARAGATNVQPFAMDSERDPKLRRLAARADVVLVDAPCSGSGTLRRNPDLKWRLHEGELAELSVKQGRILAAAAGLVKPGGVLVYATCSLFAAENDAVVEAFEAAHPGFVRESAAEVLARQGVTLAGAGRADDTAPVADGGAGAPRDPVAQALRLRPDRDDTDGFFAIRWRRAAG